MKLKSHVVRTKEYAPDTHSLRLVLQMDADKRNAKKTLVSESSQILPLHITVGTPKDVALLDQLFKKER